MSVYSESITHILHILFRHHIAHNISGTNGTKSDDKWEDESVHEDQEAKKNERKETQNGDEKSDNLKVDERLKKIFSDVLHKLGVEPRNVTWLHFALKKLYFAFFANSKCNTM